jgi:hypothetical protein
MGTGKGKGTDPTSGEWRPFATPHPADMISSSRFFGIPTQMAGR